MENTLTAFEIWAKQIGHYPVLEHLESFKQLIRSQENGTTDSRTGKESSHAGEDA